MTMTDPVADMLTRIRNACGSKHRRVDMPSSKLKVEIARILKEHNFIQDFRVLENENGTGTGPRVLRVILRYAGGQPVIREMRRVSTPGLRRYVGATEIPRVLNGMGISIVSTPKGLMTGNDAKKQNVGGELLAFVW